MAGRFSQLTRLVLCRTMNVSFSKVDGRTLRRSKRPRQLAKVREAGQAGDFPMETRVVERDRAPKFIRGPFLQQGYRVGTTLAECALSSFSWHHETMSVWSGT